MELKRYDHGTAGPSIVITAGIHGNEQTGSYTADLVHEYLSAHPEEVTGRVTIFPVCNPTAFRARQRPAPEDGLDLNRIFPGDKNGSHSQQLAAQIWDLTAGYEYVLDLHCCGLYGHTYTMCWYSRYAYAKDLCRALGVDTVIHTRGTWGQYYLECCELRQQKGLLIEMGGGQPGGVIHTDTAKACAEKVLNYLRCIGVLSGAGVKTDVTFCGFIDRKVQVKEDGVCMTQVRLGQRCKAGELLALVNGKPFPAPYDCVVTSAQPDRYIFAGDNPVRVAPTEEKPWGSVPGKVHP